MIEPLQQFDQKYRKIILIFFLMAAFKKLHPWTQMTLEGQVFLHCNNTLLIQHAKYYCIHESHELQVSLKEMCCTAHSSKC